LRWCENPKDRVAGFRVLQLLPGIGPATASKILDDLARLAHVDDLSGVQPPKTAAEEWPGFVALFKAIHKPKQTWPADIHFIRVWYEPHLAHLYDDAPLRIPDLAQLEQIASTYKHTASAYKPTPIGPL
jgi:DNA helicase-2/ATP-dependent DNA helicase PcrA